MESNQIHPFLLVIPDGYQCPSQSPGGSFWANSALNGLLEDYAANGFVSCMDENFLARNSPENRAMMGFSDGGDGVMAAGPSNGMHRMIWEEMYQRGYIYAGKSGLSTKTIRMILLK